MSTTSSRADSSSTATAVLDGFTIIGGNADGSGGDGLGGGLYNSGGSPTLINITFAGNAARPGRWHSTMTAAARHWST